MKSPLGPEHHKGNFGLHVEASRRNSPRSFVLRMNEPKEAGIGWHPPRTPGSLATHHGSYCGKVPLEDMVSLSNSPRTP